MSPVEDKSQSYLQAIASAARDRKFNGAGGTLRSLRRRLMHARLTLASLHVSERNERTSFDTEVEAYRAAYRLAGGAAKRTLAQIELNIDSHRSNLSAIKRQIELVNLAVEHLQRRISATEQKTGWPGVDLPSRTHQRPMRFQA